MRGGSDDAAQRWYLAVVVVDEDAAGAVVFEVGDLQPVGVPDLLGLEGGVDAVDLDDRFGLLGLQQRSKHEEAAPRQERSSKKKTPRARVCHRHGNAELRNVENVNLPTKTGVSVYSDAAP